MNNDNVTLSYGMNQRVSGHLVEWKVVGTNFLNPNILLTFEFTLWKFWIKSHTYIFYERLSKTIKFSLELLYIRYLYRKINLDIRIHHRSHVLRMWKGLISNRISAPRVKYFSNWNITPTFSIEKSPLGKQATKRVIWRFYTFNVF